MKNKYVGYIILGISFLIILITFMFKKALTGFVESSCTLAHGEDACPMYDTISQQTYLALAIVSILLIVGLILLFSKPEKEIVIKKIEKKKPEKRYDLSDLKPEEIRVFELIKENKTIFQADLIDKTKFGKAKMTRIIDRLEGKGIVERRRRGMTNVVVLKE